MRNVLFASFLTLSLILPSVARAETDAPPTNEHASRGYLGAGLGFAAPIDGAGGGLLVDALGLLRLGPVAVGGDVQAASRLVGSYTSASGVTGVFVPSPRWLELGLLGSIGVRNHSHVGGSLLGSDPGVSATLPVAGARGVAAIRFGDAAVSFALGLHAFVDADLERSTRTVSYTETGLFSDRATPATASHTVGATQAGALLACGASF